MLWGRTDTASPPFSLSRKVVPVVLSHVVPVPLSVSSIELPLSSLSNLSSFSLSSPPLSLSHTTSLLPNFSYWILPPWTSILGRLGNRTCTFPLFSWGTWDSSALSSRTYCKVPTDLALTTHHIIWACLTSPPLHFIQHCQTISPA